MNLFKIVTLNKHSDYEEVLFTSVLSYLLNPAFDHGLEDKFLMKIVNVLIPEIKQFNFKEISAEKSLGDKGNIDIYIDSSEYIIGIEAKIWDRSAKNISKDNEHQLERYCNVISKIAKHDNKSWFLVFLIPNELSRICLDEFYSIKKIYFSNVKLMTWNFTSDDNITNDFLSCSVSDIISEILNENQIIDSKARWILDSLFEVIPDLNSQIKDDLRFFSISELQQLPTTWKIFEPFFKISNRWPNPLTTTVGIPFGTQENKGKLHNNSLYRIRTTKKYYTDKIEKDKNLPDDYIEIELWVDIYEQALNKIHNWKEKNRINDQIIDGKHLDDKLKTNIKILKITTPLKNESIEEFNSILREGYQKLSEK